MTTFATLPPAARSDADRPDAHAPILVLDSGLGGLTVARAIRKKLPHEKIIYFGDTARVPYGGKSPEAIIAAVTQVAGRMAAHKPKHVVVACNSASAVALPALRQALPNATVSGVIEPGARAAAEAAGADPLPVIGVIATEATIRSRAYLMAIGRRRPKAMVYARATPLLVPMVEEGRKEHDPLVRLCLEQYLNPMTEAAADATKGKKMAMDVLVLGCTHYPMLRRVIQSVVTKRTKVIDSAAACAEDVASRLEAGHLLRPADADVYDPRPAVRLFASDVAARFGKMARRFLGEDVSDPVWVSPEELASVPVEV